VRAIDNDKLYSTKTAQMIALVLVGHQMKNARNERILGFHP
jgi:hypothetical protein